MSRKDEPSPSSRLTALELCEVGGQAYKNELYDEAMQYLDKALDCHVFELKDHGAVDFAPDYLAYGTSLFDYSHIDGNLLGHSRIITSSLPDHGFHSDFCKRRSISAKHLKGYGSMVPIIWDVSVNAAVKYFAELPILDVVWKPPELAKMIFASENPLCGNNPTTLATLGEISYELKRYEDTDQRVDLYKKSEIHLWLGNVNGMGMEWESCKAMKDETKDYRHEMIQTELTIAQIDARLEQVSKLEDEEMDTSDNFTVSNVMEE